MRVGWRPALCLAVLLAGCGAATAPVLRGAAAGYLLGVDQLVAPGFSLDVAPHTLSAADVAAAGHGVTSELTAAGLTGAAGEDLFRPVGDLSTSNGPVQVGDTVEEFATAGGAAASYRTDVTRLDALAGSRATSTGALGDAAHAITRTSTSAAGVAVIEVTVEWRVQNLVNILVIRGRSGGTRLDDALLLAHRQTVIELGLATPTPLPTPSPSPSVRPAPTSS